MALWRKPEAVVVLPSLSGDGPGGIQPPGERGDPEAARIFEEISRALAQRLASWRAPDHAPFATQVVCIDESTLDQVARKLTDLRGLPRGDQRLIPGKLSGLFDLRTQQWRKALFQPKAQQNEKVLARSWWRSCPRGAWWWRTWGILGLPGSTGLPTGATFG